MSIYATRVPAVRRPTDRDRACIRCGIRRQVNRGSRDKYCRDCRDVLKAEEEVWR